MDILTVIRIINMIQARADKSDAEFNAKPSEYLAGKIDALTELAQHLQEWVEYTASYEED
jgi:hypothetical protein